jgi:hypothetical protein
MSRPLRISIIAGLTTLAAVLAAVTVVPTFFF